MQRGERGIVSTPYARRSLTESERQPDPFADTFAAAAGARAIITATRLGIFDALASEPARPEALAERLGLDPVGVEALYAALLSLGYLEAQEDGVHRPSEAAARALVSSSPEYMGHFVGGYNAEAWEMLGALDDVLQGKGRARGHAIDDPGFWDDYIRGMFELSRAEHAANAELVGAPDPQSLLDVAGGHGGFAMAMCARHPRLRATVLDLPPSARVGRRIVDEQGFSDRVRFEEGDARERLPSDAQDVVGAFNLLHHLTPAEVRDLLGRCRAVLGPRRPRRDRRDRADRARRQGQPPGGDERAHLLRRERDPELLPAGADGLARGGRLHRRRSPPQRALAVAAAVRRLGRMILLTGATGVVGSALLRRLTAAGEPVRCLVRDPRRLGPERVRVQIALGDLVDPSSFRHAMRGVRTVIHLAASIRDQPSGSIEELNGIATWRMVAAAERAGVERFIFFSTLEASTLSPARFFRAKALAEDAVERSGVPHTTFAPSIVYSPGDPWLTLLERMALLSPVVPLAGSGDTLFQPIWAEDVADCVMAALDGAGPAEGESGRYELAGPDTLSHEAIVGLALRSFRRRRPTLSVPMPVVRRALRAAEALVGPAVFATAEEAELMEIRMTSRSGTADAEKRRPAQADGRRARRPLNPRLGPRPVARRDAVRPGLRGLDLRAASASSCASPAGLPISCTAVGRPSSPWKSGSEIAGSPVMFATAVNGVNWPERTKDAYGSGPSVGIEPIGTGRSASDGVRIAS